MSTNHPIHTDPSISDVNDTYVKERELKVSKPPTR